MKFFVIIKEESVRVPQKNFRELGGVPLWHRMMQTLKGQEVFVDTDSQRVLEESKAFDWVHAYERDQKHINLETDPKFGVSPVLLMIRRFITTHVEDENEIIITPHVTSPFISLETMLDAASMIGKKNDFGQPYDTVQACTEQKEFAYYYDDPVNFQEGSVMKTQDLVPIKLGNGAFFGFTKRS
ncbi:MAG: hypothetical protein P8J32_06145, partial [bacterium]|nr:hypothetical protein [bacterium]